MPRRNRPSMPETNGNGPEFRVSVWLLLEHLSDEQDSATDAIDALRNRIDRLMLGIMLALGAAVASLISVVAGA